MSASAPSMMIRTFICIAAGAFAAVAGAAEYVVGQKNKSFSVSTVQAKVGDEVLFRNDEAVFHNIFSLTSGLSFDLGAYGPGNSKKVTLEQAGKIEVECAIHPRMKMVIEVSR